MNLLLAGGIKRHPKPDWIEYCMLIYLLRPLYAVLFALLLGCQTDQRFDADQLIEDIRILSSDQMEGRKTGTEGSHKAQEYIKNRFRTIGLEPLDEGYDHPFSFLNLRDSVFYDDATNLIGIVHGTSGRREMIVVTAHYDHLGVQNGEIYNGADDNASGTSGLIAVADYFIRNPPLHDILFVAFDAEELGLQGARAFTENPPLELDRVVLNVNMDMISRNDDDEIFAAGTYHYSFLRPYLEEVREDRPITLRFGHDSPDLPPGDDWTMASDHGRFHAAGIPFIYFGVEDHEDYHQPTDVFENIQPQFFKHAVDLIIDSIVTFDRNLQDIARHAREVEADPEVIEQ